MHDLYVGIDPSMNSTGLIILSNNFDIILSKNISSDKKLSNEERIKNIGYNTLFFINKFNQSEILVTIEGISFSSIGRGVI